MLQRWYSLAISSRDEAGLSPSWGRPPKRTSSIALSVPIRPPSANGAQPDRSPGGTRRHAPPRYAGKLTCHPTSIPEMPPPHRGRGRNGTAAALAPPEQPQPCPSPAPRHSLMERREVVLRTGVMMPQAGRLSLPSTRLPCVTITTLRACYEWLPLSRGGQQSNLQSSSVRLSLADTRRVSALKTRSGTGCVRSLTYATRPCRAWSAASM